MSAFELLNTSLRPLDQWRLDPATEEIAVNGPGAAFVMQHGIWTKHTAALTYRDLYGAAVLSGALRRESVNAQSPLLGGDMPSGERFQWLVPPCVPAGTVSLTIRKPGATVSPIEDLDARYDTAGWNKWHGQRSAAATRTSLLLESFDNGNLKGFLRAAIKARLNIWLCGPTGSGKTTALKTLINLIDDSERLMTVEDALELVITQPNHVRTLYSASYMPGCGMIGPADLLKAALRMRPDRIILGELRDSVAAWIFVNAVNTGHPGSITSIHGANPKQAFTRLRNLCKGCPEGTSFEGGDLASLISGAVDIIMPFGKTDGRFEVGEVWFAADAERRGETAADLLGD